MLRASQKAAMASLFSAPRRRNAVVLICSSREAFAMEAIASASFRATTGPWMTRFIGSRGELLEDVLDGGGALLPGGKLGIDAQLFGAGEPRVAALLADELDHLGGVERRGLGEIKLHRLLRGGAPRDPQRA